MAFIPYYKYNYIIRHIDSQHPLQKALQQFPIQSPVQLQHPLTH